MKIAFIGARGVVGTYSGIETYYEELGSRLAGRGHEVTAYCRKYFTPDVPTHRGIRVRRLASINWKHLETISHSLFATVDSLFRDYDIVQYHAIGSAPLALLPRMLGRTTVVSVRGLDWQRAKWGGFARGVLRFGEWASARTPSATAVVSKRLQRHYEDAHGCPAFHIPNAVDRLEPLPVDRIREWGLEKDGYLLFTGRVSPEKGLDTLLEALRPLPRHKKLVIAGGSSYSDDHFGDLRTRAWDDVLFLGRVDHDVVRELLSNCYAFVLPSVMEGLSISLLEAVSLGNCIITTAIPENLEVVGSSALSFPSGDVAALREQLQRVLESPELVAEHRRRTVERASGWPDWDEVALRTERFYRQLLRGELQPAHEPVARHAPNPDNS